MNTLQVTVSSAKEIDAGKWSKALANGGELSLRFPDEALVAEAKLPLLMKGFVVTTETKTEMKATKKTGAKQSLQRVALDDLVDEDELLAADGMEAPEVPDDVGCSARKPCANCTCGRAEALAAEDQKAEVPSSSKCGSCHKGDAFRCASCPYLGKPAFKPGEEHLVLELTDDL